MSELDANDALTLVADLRAALTDARALVLKSNNELLEARTQIRELEIRLGVAQGECLEATSFASSREQAVIELDRMHNARVWKAMMAALAPLRKLRALRTR